MPRPTISRRAVVVGAAAALAGCAAPSGNKVFVVRETETQDTAVDKGAVPDPIVPLTWPLTGVETDKVADRPAMSIKIENSPAARPQTGLGKADVVWEEMVEGGLTRYLAVFHSSIPDVVGPIRSLRPMDAAISAPFKGLFVFSGGQPQFVSKVAATGLTMISNDAGAAGFYRTSDRPAPHNVYGDTETFLQAGKGQGAPPEQFQFARTQEQVTATAIGSKVSKVNIVFPLSHPRWAWGDGAWQRSEEEGAAVTTDGGRLTATNIVILRVKVRNTGALDPGGAPVPETILTGWGEAKICSGNHAIPGRWRKKKASSVLELVTEDGDPVLLAPGNVWVELVPESGSSVSIS